MHTLLEKIIHKMSQKINPILAPKRRKKLNNTDFTIISNNCWGGICYEYFGLQKMTPTTGTYFYAEDYLKFVLNLKYYLNCDMRIISATESKHYDSLKEKGELDVPIGVLDDIEVVFLHYKNPDIALQKWKRRVKRVNWNNIIIKFSYMNECNDNIFQDFTELTGVKKVIFIGGHAKNTNDVIYLPEYDNSSVLDDTFYWNKYIDVVDLINKPKTSYDKLRKSILVDSIKNN